MAVHTASGNEAEQMQSVTSRAGKRFLRDSVALQFAVCDSFINSGKILINNPARAQVKMANF